MSPKRALSDLEIVTVLRMVIFALTRNPNDTGDRIHRRIPSARNVLSALDDRLAHSTTQAAYARHAQGIADAMTDAGLDLSSPHVLGHFGLEFRGLVGAC